MTAVSAFGAGSAAAASLSQVGSISIPGVKGARTVWAMNDNDTQGAIDACVGAIKLPSVENTVWLGAHRTSCDKKAPGTGFGGVENLKPGATITLTLRNVTSTYVVTGGTETTLTKAWDVVNRAAPALVLQTSKSTSGPPDKYVVYLKYAKLVTPALLANINVSGVPTNWVAGQKLTFPVTVTNTGPETWGQYPYNPTGVRLGIGWGSGNFENRFNLPRSVGPGESVTIQADLTAPATPGPGRLQFRMVKEGFNTMFGDQPSKGVRIAPNQAPVCDMSQMNGRRVALISNTNYQYVTAEDGGNRPLIANKTLGEVWETFTIKYLGGNDIALVSHANGKWVTAENGGASPLIANRTEPLLWETFTVVCMGNSDVALRARVNGKFVTAENAGQGELIANRDWADAWERFVMVVK